jgi:hypothetical protein
MSNDSIMQSTYSAEEPQRIFAAVALAVMTIAVIVSYVLPRNTRRQAPSSSKKRNH